MPEWLSRAKNTTKYWLSNKVALRATAGVNCSGKVTSGVNTGVIGLLADGVVGEGASATAKLLSATVAGVPWPSLFKMATLSNERITVFPLAVVEAISNSEKSAPLLVLT